MNMEPFRIEGIEVNEMGPFNWLRLNFREKKNTSGAEIQILTGENGTGKSTLLHLLACSIPNFNKIIYKKIKNTAHTQETTVFFSDQSCIKYNQDYLIQLSKDPFQKNTNNNKDVSLNWNNGWHIESDKDFSILIDYSMNLLNNKLENDIALFAYSGYRNLVPSVIDSINEINNNPLEKALDFEKESEKGIVVKWLSILLTKDALFRNGGSNLPNHDRLAINLIEEIIGQMIGEKVFFELIPEPLSVVLNIESKQLEFDQLPDGIRSIISWVVDLVMRLSRTKWNDNRTLKEKNFILFLDEIEVHIHPAWQRKILPVLQSTFPNAQIFISTHSPFVVGSVDGAWVHRFEKKGGVSELRGEPILSEDSYSYDYILREIFGIKERFGVGVEKLLAEFRSLRNNIMHNPATDRARFDEIVKELMAQSSEVQSIVGMELRQLERILGQPAS